MPDEKSQIFSMHQDNQPAVHIQVFEGERPMAKDNVAHHNLKQMSRHELDSEKRWVKQELKRCDAEFRRQSQRLPTQNVPARNIGCEPARSARCGSA